MRNNIKERILEEADYIIKTKNTIRMSAEHFKISKSTIHKDLSERLRKIDKERFDKIKSIMDKHIEERHIKGGEATKKKYSCIAKQNAEKFYNIF